MINRDFLLGFGAGKAAGGGGGGGGGTGVPAKDVNFFDYDGTIVKAYSAADFANLTALPDNPTHTGLTAQGWNWSLSDAKTYVASYGKLNIGQMYITDDGKTRIYISLTEGRISPYLGIGVSGSVDIDWGDGSQHNTLTGTGTATLVYARHTYASCGEYVISIAPIGSGRFAFTGANDASKLLSANGENAADGRDPIYRHAIKRVEIGNGVGLSQLAFSRCISISSIALPTSITSFGVDAFFNCSSLTYITIPSGVASLGTTIFRSCPNLYSIAMPIGMTTTGSSAFQYCYSLSYITIPSSVNTIGASTFTNCNALSTITIPSSVTSINQSAFSSCNALASIHFKRTAPPTAGANAFNGIPTDCIIYVPASADHSILNAYKAADNYPDPATYTYMEE